MRDLSWSCPYSPQTECPARSTLNPRPYKMQNASNHALRTATEAVLLPGSTPGADGTVLGPSCWAPSPLEYASALEHTHSTVPGLPSVKLSLSLGRPRRRTTPPKRSNACMHRREHTAAMLPKSLTSSDTTVCARPDLLALLLPSLLSPSLLSPSCCTAIQSSPSNSWIDWSTSGKLRA